MMVVLTFKEMRFVVVGISEDLWASFLFKFAKLSSLGVLLVLIWPKHEKGLWLSPKSYTSFHYAPIKFFSSKKIRSKSNLTN